MNDPREDSRVPQGDRAPAGAKTWSRKARNKEVHHEEEKTTKQSPTAEGAEDIRSAAFTNKDETATKNTVGTKQVLCVLCGDCFY
jgi:NAD-dependent dihydropyrimidine dehydrogenase PreA subunit